MLHTTEVALDEKLRQEDKLDFRFSRELRSYWNTFGLIRPAGDFVITMMISKKTKFYICQPISVPEVKKREILNFFC